MNWEGKMLKKIGFTTAALFGLLLVGNAKPAKADVRFGVYLGAPAYTYPVDPYAYSNAYPYPYGYTAPVYRAPSYVAPYSYGYRDRDHDRHEWRERQRNHRHDQQDHRDRRR